VCRKWVGGFECVETVPDVGWKSAREKNLYGSRTGEREKEREMKKRTIQSGRYTKRIF